MIRVQGGENAAQTPIQQQAFSLRGWIDASIRQPRNKEEVALLKESIRRVTSADFSLEALTRVTKREKGADQTNTRVDSRK